MELNWGCLLEAGSPQSLHDPVLSRTLPYYTWTYKFLGSCRYLSLVPLIWNNTKYLFFSRITPISEGQLDCHLSRLNMPNFFNDSSLCSIYQTPLHSAHISFLLTINGKFMKLWMFYYPKFFFMSVYYFYFSLFKMLQKINRCKSIPGRFDECTVCSLFIIMTSEG